MYSTSADNVVYRNVEPDEYFFGYLTADKPRSRLIIYCNDDLNLGREYEKRWGTWCSDGVLSEPSNHLCQPKNIAEIMAEQDVFEDEYKRGNLPESRFNDIINDALYEKFSKNCYKYGLSPSGIQDGRLIVQNKESIEYVYHYKRSKNGWICEKCYGINHDVAVGYFIHQDLYLPKNHICKPILGDISAEEQQKFENPVDKFEKIFIEKEDEFKRIDKDDFHFGVLRSLSDIEKRLRLIVCHPHTRRLVYEYRMTAKNLWNCSKCGSKRKRDTYAVMKDGTLYATTEEHVCDPITYSDAMKKELFLQCGGSKSKITAKKVAERMRKFMPGGRTNSESDSAASRHHSAHRNDIFVGSPSPVPELTAPGNSDGCQRSTSSINDVLHSVVDVQVSQNGHQRSSNDVNAGDHGSDENIQTGRAEINDDLTVADNGGQNSATAAAQLTRESNEYVAIPYVTPNQEWFKKMYEKIQLAFTETAKFWRNFELVELWQGYLPQKTAHVHHTDSFFRWTIAGQNFAQIAVNDSKFYEIYKFKELKDVHIHIICQWLECRLGIFADNDLELYGDWNNQDSPILLIKNEDSIFKPILS
uniref:Uncharacterized protein n=1 Tax=Panagrolaimus sp. ES5 TaxID=591445 RepID=A0AC34FJT1_9BILA